MGNCTYKMVSSENSYVYFWKFIFAKKRGGVASPTTLAQVDRDEKGKHAFLYPSRRVVQFVCDAQK